MKRAMRWLGLITPLLLLGATPASDDSKAEPKVDVKVVKYDELTKTITGLKGKVVVVDFWADTWLSCKREFPHLVEMHKKYAKDGLVAVSVSLDDPNDKGVKEKVLKFLASKKAAFTNLILDESADVWQEKLKIDGPPAVFVFNREGEQAKKFTEDFKYAEVEKLAQELLKK